MRSQHGRPKAGGWLQDSSRVSPLDADTGTRMACLTAIGLSPPGSRPPSRGLFCGDISANGLTVARNLTGPQQPTGRTLSPAERPAYAVTRAGRVLHRRNSEEPF